EKHAADNPRAALTLLDAVAPLAPDPQALAQVRQPLLERVVQKEPDDPEAASQLALVYEAQKHMDRCEKLLTPLRARLGTTEGARILGQIYARKGQFDDAHALLQPYMDGRLQKYRQAEQAFHDARQQAEGLIANEVRNGTAPGFPWERFRQANQHEKTMLFFE